MITKESIEKVSAAGEDELNERISQGLLSLPHTMLTTEQFIRVLFTAEKERIKTELLSLLDSKEE